MSMVRLRRLQADYELLRAYVSRHPRLQLIQAEGNPPERYQLEYRINSLRQRDSELEEVRSHLVEIMLTRNYPRNPPQCRMLTPVFHPNIAPHAICIGDHWSAGEPLSSIVARIGELLAYQSYNTKSPLNGEAARWVDQNLSRLPLDPVSMMVEEPAPSAGATGAARPASASPASAAANGPAPPPTPTPAAALALRHPVAKASANAAAASGGASANAQAPGVPGAPGGDNSLWPPNKPASTIAGSTPAAPIPAAPRPTASTPAAPRPAAASAPQHTIVSCPGCEAQIRVPAGKGGKHVRCPRCSAPFQLPL